ncbi:hypothetical protein L1987_63098 [Smallanthus sonchifolius]|uniref:Uncharacterized protein n=1 Tax=Smallanthus sonchifolius TaxID=185202 RepID=A0ACB9CCA8_9ASTR|nr:hypothetical protein L1987_63098 [Smallanthus sonchifolius]
METHVDFLELLEPDMGLKILACLDDSADLVRASAVSRCWQNIVVSNGLSKQLCMRTFPQLAIITRVVEPSHDNSGERDHRAYASLFRALTAFPLTYCVADVVSASSTDNYPAESVMNTLFPVVSILHRSVYWSSKGTDDPETQETLIYSLTSSFCVVREVNLHPFQDMFGFDFPIYSSRFVRFRMGHPKSRKELNYDFIQAQEYADDKFIWTYTSQMFPVAKSGFVSQSSWQQKNCLQRFKLPEPVVCIGGYLQIEFLGRVQKAWDAKYYICFLNLPPNAISTAPLFNQNTGFLILGFLSTDFSYLHQRKR